MVNVLASMAAMCRTMHEGWSMTQGRKLCYKDEILPGIVREAAKVGREDLLNWLLHYPARKHECKEWDFWARNCFESAARNGHVIVFEWDFPTSL